jgi:hypothetical protein
MPAGEKRKEAREVSWNRIYVTFFIGFVSIERFPCSGFRTTPTAFAFFLLCNHATQLYSE